MNTLSENIFVVGPQVSGKSFFGRLDEIRDIEMSIFYGVGAVHLVGPTRIGKSSIITRVFEKNANFPNRICIQMSMGECSNAKDFWETMANELKERIYEANIWNKDIERYFNEINNSVNSDSPNWFPRFRNPLKSVLKKLKDIGYRLVLSIDEFDSVDRIFGQESHYFQVLRSIYYEPSCVTSGVIISRKRLNLLEAKCKDISTFHGVFREKTLLAFNEKDMDDFYNNLSLYELYLSDSGKKKLEQYTGKLPYLCCMFGERLVAHFAGCGEIGENEVTYVFKECLPQIDRHYDDLIERLEYDNHTEIVCFLALSSKFPTYITNRDIENLINMGVLITETENGTLQYYAYSKDFMTYFKLRPLKLPAWETMTQSEKRIKGIFKKEYPKLDEVTYDDLLADSENKIIKNINDAYPELKLNSGKIKRFCEDLSLHKEHPTILDVMTLSEIVRIIIDTWSTRFHKYFFGDDSWKTKLEYIKEIRNPIAHAAIEYIDSEELSVCMQYCDDIIHM